MHPAAGRERCCVARTHLLILLMEKSLPTTEQLPLKANGEKSSSLSLGGASKPSSSSREQKTTTSRQGSQWVWTRISAGRLCTNSGTGFMDPYLTRRVQGQARATASALSPSAGSAQPETDGVKPRGALPPRGPVYSETLGSSAPRSCPATDAKTN